MKQSVAASMAAFALVLAVSCTPAVTSPSTSDTVPVSGIITLPSCLSTAATTSSALGFYPEMGAPFFAPSASVTSNNAEAVKDIFGSIRRYVGACDYLARYANTLMQAVVTNMPSNGIYAGPLSGGKWVVLTNTSSVSTAYNHHLEIWADSNKSGSRLLLLDFDKSSKSKGVLTISSNYAPNTFHGNIRVTFDGTTTPQTMTVEAGGFLQATNTDKWGLDNIKLVVTKNGSTLTVSGNSWHPNAGTDTNGFNDNKGRFYLFTANGDSSSNVAVVRLAVPPSDVSDSANFFTDNSVGVEWTAATLTKAKAWGVNWSNIAVALGLSNSAVPTANSALTTNQLVNILVTASTNTNLSQSTIDGIASMLFITGLGNPTYFQNNGYVTNGVSTLAGYPASATLDAISTLAPSSVRALSTNITF